MTHQCCLYPCAGKRSTSFWAGLEADEIAGILQQVSTFTRTFSQGVSIESDNEDDYLMYLLEGHVSVSVALENGKFIPLRHIHTGEVFGVSSGSEINGTLAFSAESISTVQFIHKPLFLGVLTEHPQLLANYLAFMNHRISYLLNKVILFSIQNNRQRIACFFLGEMKQQQENLLTVDLSKTCLLECLGMSRSSFYRELNALTAAGAIHPVGRKQYQCNTAILNEVLSRDP
ncbi:Crp/Fnr family transcriptional regulator [Anoxynatronum buryatiense]|uniref:cAMP-binding domain of CRP or a regulatory subunit of cAMP-dependent protein kinases n=1 Tax=Anoxynatronum buryatiense TaxID=489973 RepID=A0AA45WWQ8_9CLOT|nr:Crp/Fnr family transcriptional regulator [Anoxynatronum buryatiense]SMP60604.1 cAMP-binding domain of CRP or a regulatory subunit of cAMP-dependent protein kinases [Anoxynatronum buryatiense]